ncbi:MAG: histidine--tRNA ligase [Candidatus Micrarchaeia archaeon]
MEFSAPKGMRDFLPDEMQRRERALSAIRGVYGKYGFLAMDTPALEAVETLERKCGSEIKGQLFRVEGGKLALRFDLTVPLARVASSNTFKKPFKRFCVGPVWRREEPQKGRFREFLQADADIIGCPGMRAEAELLACATDALSALGFKGAMILLNDRRLISKIAEGLLPGKEGEMLRILDKREKIGSAAVLGMMVGAGAGEASAQKLLQEISKEDSNENKLKIAEKYSPEAASDLRQVILLLEEYGAEAVAEIDFSLVRGLDYYTGPIFEISLGGGMGSVAGGGRYDNLLSVYGQGDSAVGISLGVERLLALMEKPAQEKWGVFVACVKEENYPYALRVAAELRKAGVAAQTDLNCRSFKKQLELAAASCAYLAVVGENEEKGKKVMLKNLLTGKEEPVSVKDAAALILGK